VYQASSWGLKGLIILDYAANAKLDSPVVVRSPFVTE
jgi:hypothetical protein